MQAILEKRICVLGLGYIGLPTAAVLASRGYAVHGVEVNATAAETINAGKAHIIEPELDILVRSAVGAGRLKAHPEPAAADVFMICVPTPLNSDQMPDLSYVDVATRSIASVIQAGNLVILESTSPPGTTERIAGELFSARPDLRPGSVHFAHAPERVLPGRILREVVENDRIIGGCDVASTEVCAEFYRTFVSGELHLTTARTAETVKLVENAFRDVNIAFANELSLVAADLSLDVWEIIRLANKHPRVNILKPGPGVGGHCIAVDPWFLVHAAPESSRLMRRARDVNRAKPHWVLEQVRAAVDRFKAPQVACLGLSYKENIDDLRESPALEIARQIARLPSVGLRVVEPNLTRHEEFELLPLERALDGADIVVILVGHRAFRGLRSEALATKVVFDICGLLRG